MGLGRLGVRELVQQHFGGYRSRLKDVCTRLLQRRAAAAAACACAFMSRLPEDVWSIVLEMVGLGPALAVLARLNAPWYQLVRGPHIWRRVRLSPNMAAHLSDENVADLSPAWASLTDVDLSECVLISGKGLAAVASHATRLATLRLPRCARVDDAALQALSCLPALTALDLSFNPCITAGGVRALMGGLSAARLREKRARAETLSAAAAVGLEATSPYASKAAAGGAAGEGGGKWGGGGGGGEGEGGGGEEAERWCRLRDLRLQRCPRLADEAAGCIGEYGSVLQSLDLTWCKDVTDAGVLAVAAGCRELLSLSLRWLKKVTDAGAHAVLRHCRKLRSLNLDHCSALGDASLVALAAAPALAHASMAYCALLTDQGLHLLVQAAARAAAAVSDEGDGGDGAHGGIGDGDIFSSSNGVLGGWAKGGGGGSRAVAAGGSAVAAAAAAAAAWAEDGVGTLQVLRLDYCAGLTSRGVAEAAGRLRAAVSWKQCAHGGHERAVHLLSEAECHD